MSQIDIWKRETSKSSSMKADRGLSGLKARSLKERVQELYRPRRSSLGYKLLDYNILSTSRIQVIVQVK